MSTKTVKKQLFAQLAVIGKALSSGNRLELLDFLAQGERSVEVLAKMSDMSVANTSQHLQHLRRAGLVDSRKDGQQVIYSIAGDAVVGLVGALCRTAESNLAELDRLVVRYLKAKDSLEPVPADELARRIRKGTVTVLDVRPPEEYASGHVAGAINIPLKDFEARRSELPAGVEVVAYCRGPYCLLAFDAVARLREMGYQALRLEGGFPDWKLAGMPVEGKS